MSITPINSINQSPVRNPRQDNKTISNKKINALGKTLKIIILENEFVKIRGFKEKDSTLSDELEIHQVFVDLGNREVLLHFFHQNWFMKPDNIPDESIFKKYNSIEIFLKNNTKNKKISNNLSENFKRKLLKFLQEGRPNKKYFCSDFFHYMQNVPSSLNCFDKTQWNEINVAENSMRLEQGLVFKKVKKNITENRHWAVSITNKLTISIFGEGPLIVVSPKSFKKFYQTDLMVGWNKRDFNREACYEISKLIMDYLGNTERSHYLNNCEILIDELFLHRIKGLRKENPHLFLDRSIKAVANGILKMLVLKKNIRLNFPPNSLITRIVLLQLDNGCRIPLHYLHQDWFFKEKTDGSIMKKYNKLEIIYDKDNNKFENLSNLFSENFKNNLLHYIKNGRWDPTYGNIDFFRDLNGLPFNTCLYNSKYQVTLLNENALQPEQGVIFRRNQEDVHYAIFFIDNWFLSVFGNGPIVLSDLNSMKSLVHADSCLSWKK